MRFIVDLHCHTKEYSYDGQVSGEEIVRKLVHEGFQGVVFTDHNNVWPDDELEELRKNAGLPKEFFLASGQEVRTRQGDLLCGDLLVYGPKQSIPDGTQITEVLELAKQADGFCIAAHPGVPKIGLNEQIGDFPILATETWNGRYGPKVASISNELADTFSLPKIGGSDTHQPDDIAGGGTEFFEQVKSLNQMAKLIANEETKIFKRDFSTKIKRLLNIKPLGN